MKSINLKIFYYPILVILLICNLNCKNKPPKFTITDENTIENTEDFPELKKLSEYGKFNLPLKNMQPVDEVFFYDLNSSLFSDYAYKKRFIYLPNGKKMKYDDYQAFDFPEGSIIFKFFYYPSDFNKPNENIRIIETRILIKSIDSWQTLTYIWNDEQTDAFLSLAGGYKNVEWLDQDNKKHSIKYSVPGILVCKSCHESNGNIVPIGPAARHLNKFYSQQTDKNQLLLFADNKKLSGLPSIKNIPQLASWEDSILDINDRSRAYLDINCAHCHRKEGPAKNSGLYLLADEKNPFIYGINKPPVAAGRGSGNFRHAIEPGNPEESILTFRMKSLEPGIMMPEAGRRTIHDEGVTLISNWIKGMQK